MTGKFSVDVGVMSVDYGNKTRFTTDRRYPVVLGEKTYVSSGPGYATLYTLLTDDNQSGAAHGFISPQRDVFEYKIMTRGVHYEGFPDFVYVNAEIYDNYNGTRQVSITGSYIMTFIVGALPSADTYGAAYASDVYKEAMAGFWLIASVDYYINGNGDVIRRTTYTRPLTLTVAHDQEPSSGYSAYEEYMAIRDLHDQEIRNKLEYDEMYSAGGKNYQKWLWKYENKWAKVVAGKFTA